MKQLQNTALILGTISVLVNMYALYYAFLGLEPNLPKLLWGLHIGVFICFGPIIIIRTKRINKLNNGQESNSKEARKAIWEGINQWPFRMLWIYGILVFFFQLRFQSSNETEPWLFFSIGWMAFYYISWSMIRNERTYQVAA